jgi:iron complex transport system substrate-binding protein
LAGGKSVKSVANRVKKAWLPIGIATLLIQLPLLASESSVFRAVSLVPSVTEMIYALGAQDKLVGVATPCDYPPGIDLPIVGNFSFPNVERIAALKPDVVFVAGVEQEYLWSKLKELGLHPVIVAPGNLQEIYESIIRVGKLLGRQSEADSLVRALEQEFEEMREIVPAQTRTVFIEISDNPLMTCGKGSFLNELLSLAGATNIAGDIDKPYPVVSSEFAVQANPDVIVVTHPGGKPSGRLGWEKVRAVREQMVHSDIDPNLILRPGPRVIQGIRELKKRIYPELFPSEK